MLIQASKAEAAIDGGDFEGKRELQEKIS